MRIDNKINDVFEIICWKEISTLHLRYKNSPNDGFIITSTPYFIDGKMCFNVTIIEIDSNKTPKPGLTKYFHDISDPTYIDFLKNYLLQTAYAF